MIIGCILFINVVGASDVNETDMQAVACDSQDAILTSNEFNITDSNQVVYFQSGGISKSMIKVNRGDTLNLIGTFTDRTFRIDIPVNIVGSNCLLQNCNFIIANGGSGSNITNLHIVNANNYGILIEASNCTVKDSSIYSNGDGGFNIILNPKSRYNKIINNFLKTDSYKYGSVTKSTSNIVLGGADYNYIANNYLEFNDANSIYLSQWGSNAFVGGISNYNVIFNNTLQCRVVPTSWCYGIQIYGVGNKVDSNKIIGTYRGISGDEGTIITNNEIINLTGKDYDTNTLTGAEYAIISRANSIIENNTISNSIISKSVIYACDDTLVCGNIIDVKGNAYGIEAIGDNINVSKNRILVTSGSGIYQVGKYSGLFVGYNNITATFGVGILVKKASSTKYPSNVAIIGNNIITYNKYSINIKDIKGTYIISDNICNSMVLTPDSESGVLNNTCYFINLSGTFDDLAEAIEIIEDGGIINLTGDIHLMGIGSTDASGIVVSKSVTIEGNNFEINAHERCVRVFNITDNGNVTLKNLLLHGCYLLYDDYYAESLEGVEEEYTGAVIYNTGNLTVINSTFIANKANIAGAIYNGGNLDITDSTFRNNQAISKSIYDWEDEDDGIHFVKKEGGGAGAIYNDGYLNIKNTVFHNNLAESSTGAIYNDGVLYMDGCFVFSNKASGPAAATGAIYNGNNATINNTRFLDNRASQGGVIVTEKGNLLIENSDLSQNLVYYDHFGGSGGVIMGDGNIKIVKSNFTANTCQGEGGVIYTSTGYGSSYADITIDGCNFNQNFASSGGAINNVAHGTLNVLNSLFDGNKAGDGAAILNLYADMLIDGSVFDSNIASGSVIRNNFVSGGVVSSNGVNNVIVNSQFTNNKNMGTGPGTVNLGGKSIIDNSSFIANSAKNGYGGALYVRDATITNSEFTNNTAKSGNGIYVDYPRKPSESFDNGYFDESGKYNLIVKPDNPVVDNPTEVVDNSTEVVDNPVDNSTDVSGGSVVDNSTEVVDNLVDNSTDIPDASNNPDTNNENNTEPEVETNPSSQIEDDSSNTNSTDNVDNNPIDEVDSNNSVPVNGTVSNDSMSSSNSTNVDDSLSTVGETPNAISSSTQSSSSTSNTQSNADEPSSESSSEVLSEDNSRVSPGVSSEVLSRDSSEISQEDSSKAYELNKNVDKQIVDSNNLIIPIIGAIALFLLLIIGYRRGKNDDL